MGDYTRIPSHPDQFILLPTFRLCSCYRASNGCSCDLCETLACWEITALAQHRKQGVEYCSLSLHHLRCCTLPGGALAPSSRAPPPPQPHSLDSKRNRRTEQVMWRKEILMWRKVILRQGEASVVVQIYRCHVRRKRGPTVDAPPTICHLRQRSQLASWMSRPRNLHI